MHFFIGINVAVTNSKLGILSLFCILTILVLFSDKFSGVFGVIIYYSMGFYLSKNAYNKTISIGLKKKIIFLYLAIIFIFLLSIVVVGFIYLQGANDNDLADRILARALGLQAHVWYGIDEQMFTKAIDFDPEIFFLQSDEPIQPAGLEYLMYQVADYDFVKAFREAGIRFTNGYPAIVAYFIWLC